MKINLETKTNFIETVELDWPIGGGMPWDLITLKSGAVLVITEESVNVAVLHIQNALGVKHGDLAGMFFTGDHYYNIVKTLYEYIDAEEMNVEVEQ